MNQKSFTLIEILVVIVVIGILSSFILVGMSFITNSSNIAKEKAFANSVRNSLLISLVSEYKLDGNANDSWNINNGVLNNFSANPWKDSSQCVNSQCLEFDGFDDSMSISKNFFGGLTSLTVEGWVNGQQTANFLKTENGVLIFHFNGAGFYLTAEDDTTSGYLGWDSSMVFNKWYHIIALWDGTTMKLYKNGVCQNTTRSFIGGTTGKIKSVSTLYIGTYFNINQPYFKGLIDEVRVYNKSLTALQINQNYFLGLNNLYKNRGITENEYIERIAELKINLTQE